MSTESEGWQKKPKSMRKASSESQVTSLGSRMQRSNAGGSLLSGMLQRTPSGNLLTSFHAPEKWEEQGGWQARAPEARQLHHMERDASMVQLLNLVAPNSLVDKAPKPGEIIVDEQHSALSRRGVLYVGGISAFAWYALRLVLRDIVRLPNEVMELHALGTIHAVGWAAFLTGKIDVPDSELPKYCSRALVASLGYYLQECWALRGTMLSNPSMLLHHASMAVTVSSMLRSKGVAWLAVPIMSQAIPNLLQEMLRLCGSIGIPAVRPEVRGLRLVWFLSFVTSKLAIVPTWLRHRNMPEMHQPNLFYGKYSYLVCFVFDTLFMSSAVRDLRRFLRPAGIKIPAALAYKKPLQGAQAVGTTLVAATVLGTVFGSYLTAPTALVLSLLGLRFKNLRLRVAAASLCSLVALDKILPYPKEFPTATRLMMPILRIALNIFNWKVLPGGLDTLRDLPKDRHHLIASTPHGLFPWAAGGVIVSCIDAGYLPNFIGASVLGALPVAGRILRYLGFVPASKKEMLKSLKKEYPRNITIILPGGIREMFQIREDIEISSANVHANFCSIAKEGGAMLVPSYAFGVSQLYKVATGPLGVFFANLSSKLRTSIALFTGRWGTLLPYPYEMSMSVGKPVDTLLCADGNEVHRLFLENLRASFEEQKGAFGWQDRELYFEGEDMPPPPRDPLSEYMALPSSSRSRL